MMVHFRKRFSQEELNRINELIAERGKALVKEAMASVQDEDDSDDSDDDTGNQLSLDDYVKPADWPEGKNLGTLTIDASCTPADITYPTDLKLVNEARQSTERIIDDLSDHAVDLHNTVLAMTVAKHVPTSSMLPSRKSHAAAKSKLRFVVSWTTCSAISMLLMPWSPAAPAFRP